MPKYTLDQPTNRHIIVKVLEEEKEQKSFEIPNEHKVVPQYIICKILCAEVSSNYHPNELILCHGNGLGTFKDKDNEINFIPESYVIGKLST